MKKQFLLTLILGLLTINTAHAVRVDLMRPSTNVLDYAKPGALTTAYSVNVRTPTNGQSITYYNKDNLPVTSVRFDSGGAFSNAVSYDPGIGGGYTDYYPLPGQGPGEYSSGGAAPKKNYQIISDY